MMRYSSQALDLGEKSGEQNKDAQSGSLPTEEVTKQIKIAGFSLI